MAEIIGVKFKQGGKLYYFNPNDQYLLQGTQVIVETARGLECGEVAMERRTVPDDQITHELKNVIREATAEDIRRVEENRRKEESAFVLCEQKIAARGLDMKLVSVEYAFDGSKILFCFTADGRVDFRELVKDLAGVFHTRIELRQIGVRDEAKMLGGLGICGRPFCCSSFLGDFMPVSIKMAKEQGLSLNPVKISGTCGRLMCCLKYEEEAYADLLRHTPRAGTRVSTPDGKGVIVDVDLITGVLHVKLDDNPDAAPRIYNKSQLKSGTYDRREDDGTHELELVEKAPEPEQDSYVSQYARVEQESPSEDEKASGNQGGGANNRQRPQQNAEQGEEKQPHVQQANNARANGGAQRPKGGKNQNRPNNQQKNGQNRQNGSNNQNPQNNRAAQGGHNGQQKNSTQGGQQKNNAQNGGQQKNGGQNRPQNGGKPNYQKNGGGKPNQQNRSSNGGQQKNNAGGGKGGQQKNGGQNRPQNGGKQHGGSHQQNRAAHQDNDRREPKTDAKPTE